MINNLVDYFVSEQEFYLDTISYNRMDKKEQTTEYLLNCIDNIDVEVNEETVNLIVKRVLNF